MAIRECARPARRGFTLIEVLVVVAIIALLVAILLPSLARARAHGRNAACLSNLHQIGLSMQEYASGNNDFIPRACNDGDPTNWTVVVARSMGYIRRVPSGFVVGDLQVGKMPIFHCPERVTTLDFPFLDYLVNAMDPEGPRVGATGSSLGVPGPNGEWQQMRHFDPTTVGLCRLTVYRRPSEVIYIIDAERENKNIQVNGVASLEEARRNVSGNLGIGVMDVWRGVHVPQGKLNYNLNDNPGPRRAARKMHVNRFTNASFLDGHAAGVPLVNRPLANGQPDHVAQYAYWLRLFGVKDPVTIAANDPDLW